MKALFYFTFCSATFAVASSNARSAGPGVDDLSDPPYAFHIFNAIQSSMRQWGSSLNHNGMSFFLATVPQGVQLYHGNNKPETVHGMEWLAFEPEHAILFAWVIVDDPESPALANGSLDSSIRKESANTEEHDSQIYLKRPQSARAPPSFDVRPGWLQTYTTKRDLKLLYIDGQSAAKSEYGPLDSQDYILRLHGDPESPRNPWNDIPRAKELCKTAQTHWESKIDGFIRMEGGFEILLCDFDAGLEKIRATKAWEVTDKPQTDIPGNYLSYFKAFSARYFDIGGGRVRLDYDHFVTAYTYKDINLFTADAEQPRLNNVSTQIAEQMFQDIKQLISKPHTFVPGTTDWQAVTDMIIERYGRRLPYLVSAEHFTNVEALAHEINLVLRPFIDYDERNTTAEIARCTTNFIPQDLSLNQQSSLAARAVHAVSQHICTTLSRCLSLSHFNNNDSEETLQTMRTHVQTLISDLNWTVWKYCAAECALNEICFTAIWPFGSWEDHLRPGCRNATQILNSRSYWDVNQALQRRSRKG